MRENFKIFYRAFLGSLTALLCPVILVYGIITADLNTKKIGYNKQVEVLEVTDGGNVLLLGKDITRYLEFTKIPAKIISTLTPDYLKRIVYYEVNLSENIKNKVL